MKKVIVLVGPTASGKTKYSIELAKALNGEIINGDSVQIYKELNIGSAKITKNEMENVPHHLFSVETVLNSYTAYNFQKDVRALINKIDVPLVVGGTGFYIKAALYNYEFNDEEYNFNDFDSLSNEEIYELLIKLDPNLEIDKFNRHRLVRAYHQALNGNLRSEKKAKDEPLYNILTIYLDIDRIILTNRLHERLDIMLKEGFIEEVESLFKQDIHLNMVGYREVDEYLKNNYTYEQMKEEIIRTSKKLAKKQKTWFKNQMDAKLFDPLNEDSLNEMISLAKQFLKEDDL